MPKVIKSLLKKRIVAQNFYSSPLLLIILPPGANYASRKIEDAVKGIISIKVKQATVKRNYIINVGALPC